MDVSVIYSPFYLYKTQFIWRLLCRIHGLLLPAVILSPGRKCQFRSVEWGPNKAMMCPDAHQIIHHVWRGHNIYTNRENSTYIFTIYQIKFILMVSCSIINYNYHSINRAQSSGLAETKWLERLARSTIQHFWRVWSSPLKNFVAPPFTYWYFSCVAFAGERCSPLANPLSINQRDVKFSS